jgi:hypothetical protein
VTRKTTAAMDTVMCRYHDLVVVAPGFIFGGVGWVGRAARCLLGRSFSAQPPAEPDVPAFRASRLSSDHAVNVLAGRIPWMWS